jgi:phosphonate transport system permease protein
MIETIHIATLGTLLSLVAALPLAFMAARNFTPFPVLNWVAQFIFVTSRSVNSLVWALLFVAIFGPGALAGILAIAFRSIGFVGPIEALNAIGAPGSMVLAKGYWPQAEPAFWSIALLRWDINIRESAVLGLVGAGGIGLALNASLDNLYWDEVGLILAVILLVVMATEIISSKIRARII